MRQPPIMFRRRIAGRSLSIFLGTALVMLASLVPVSCGDDTVDPADVTGAPADLVIYMSPDAPQEQIDKVKLELEVAKQGGELTSYDFFNASDTAKIIGAIAKGGEIDPTKKIPSLFTVVLAKKGDAETKAATFRLLPGVESVTTDGIPKAPDDLPIAPDSSSVPIPTAPG